MLFYKAVRILQEGGGGQETSTRAPGHHSGKACIREKHCAHIYVHMYIYRYRLHRLYIYIDRLIDCGFRAWTFEAKRVFRVFSVIRASERTLGACRGVFAFYPGRSNSIRVYISLN